MGLDLRWRCPRCNSAQYGSHRYCSNCGTQKNNPVGCAGCGGCLGVLILIAIGLSCMGVGSCFYAIAVPTSYQAEVNAVSWERTIEIERNDLRSKEGPKDTIPADAVDIKRKGKGKTTTPIFTYEVREWGPDRTLRAGGKNHIDIRWPVETSDTKGLERDPQERETRREQYFVSMRYGDYYIVRFPVKDEATFRKFQLGSQHVITPMRGYVLIGGERYDH
jgi:hypothetical protein